MTNAAFQAILAGCNFSDPEQVSKLIAQRYTSQKIDELVTTRHMGCYDGFGYFSNFFPVKTWQDGQGQTELREVYHHPRVPYSFNYFMRTMQVCDPNTANECVTQYCDIPEGGYGNLPQLEMYRWGLKTHRECVANIRHIRDFGSWSKRIVQSRFYVEQQIMQMFYTLAAIRTCGHKMVLETARDADGLLQPLVDSSNRNPLGGYAHSYMEPLFPAVGNPANIVPLSIDVLEQLARRWSIFCNDNHVATGVRGEKIWEFWYPDDWYKTEGIDNPDIMEKLKYTMPNKLFAGYNPTGTGEREVIGNWAMRAMPGLPRFGLGCDGGLVPIDMHVEEDIEIGKEAVESSAWQQAPILMAIAPSPSMGTIMVRPDLNTDARGNSIMPIMGNGGWIVRNDYDATCNPELNMPYHQKRFEMGFRLEDPNAAIAFLFRARKFRIRGINECDFQPMNDVLAKTTGCPATERIGCQDNRRTHGESITTLDTSKYVLCHTVSCGASGVQGQSTYQVELEWKGNRVGFNHLDCACGSTVSIAVYDCNGDLLRIQDAVVQDMLPHGTSPRPIIWLRTVTLGTDDCDECIKGIMCQDADPLVATVTNAWTAADKPTCPTFTGITWRLGAPINCNAGDNVDVKYYDVNDVLLDTVVGAVIAVANPQTQTYQITSADPDYTKAGPAGTSYITITCT